MFLKETRGNKETWTERERGERERLRRKDEFKKAKAHSEECTDQKRETEFLATAGRQGERIGSLVGTCTMITTGT